MTPPFVDSHFHMDSTLSLGNPRLNESGTLLEGIKLWGELKPHLDGATRSRSAREALPLGDRQGDAARSAAMSISATTGCWRSMRCCEVRKEDARPGSICSSAAFPQDGSFVTHRDAPTFSARSTLGSTWSAASRISSARWATAPTRYHALRDRGADVACRSTCTATRPTIRCRGTSRTLAAETRRLGLAGPRDRLAPHLDASMDNYYVSKLIPLIRPRRACMRSPTR